jgi:hypothetical protein
LAEAGPAVGASMAMAVDGSHVHSGMTSGSTQASENGWSSAAWEQQHGLAESLSMEGSGGGDYGGGGRMEWELKANSWEWENLTMVYPRQGEAQQRLQGGEWESGACSAVTLATSAGAGSATGDFSIGLASGSSTPSGTSVSSGIPGVGAGRGSSGGDPAPSVKSEPDEQTVAGSPAALGGQEDRLFFDLGGRRSRASEEESPERDGSGSASGGQRNGSSVVSGGGDSLNIGLKLGRRTYFKDSAAGGQGKGPSSPAAASPPVKKQRVMSASTQAARCQVEGCKADLSGCKDYHKRHKVCEMHSKAPKAIAGGIEQRFCQQCSRCLPAMAGFVWSLGCGWVWLLDARGEWGRCCDVVSVCRSVCGGLGGCAVGGTMVLERSTGQGTSGATVPCSQPGSARSWDGWKGVVFLRVLYAPFADRVVRLDGRTEVESWSC